MGLSPGTKLGPYEIASTLGAGGMGEVYRARDTRLGRDVAVKVLPESVAKDADRLLRFEQEARTIAALNHPNILGIFDVGVQGTTHYLVTELLEGETLRQKLESGPLPVRRATEYAAEIADGLAAAHAKGVIHRDLKPENVFIVKTGGVKILDFGLAKAAPVAAAPAGTQETVGVNGTAPGMVMGTAGYMSPEQVRGERVDHRTDIFSFGAVLYEMVSGKRAFQKGSAVETMSAILKEDVPELSDSSVAISPGIDRIIRRCLEKTPERRFQSASDLAFAIEALSAPSGASTAVQAIAKPKPRRWTAVALVGVLAALAIAFIVGRRLGHSPPPTFRPLVSGPGMISSARFTPDAQNVVYGAAWRGKPFELFTTRIDSIESRSMALPAGNITGLSQSGDMLILLGWHSRFWWNMSGTLARGSLSGGAPRPLLEDVCAADIDAGGKEVAVVRCGSSLQTLEYPLGHVIYRTTGWVDHVRFSPTGDAIGFLDHPVAGDDRGYVAWVDRQGKVSRVTGEWAALKGLAWTPNAEELWFSGTQAGEQISIWSVTRSGRQRLVFTGPADLWLQDIAGNGRTLMTEARETSDIAVRRPGQQSDQVVDLASEAGTLGGISDNGSLMALSYVGVASGTDYLTYVANTDTHEVIRLGDGSASGISPDGKWVVSFFPSTPGKMALYPTGPGETRIFNLGGIRDVSVFCSWTHDSSKVVFAGTDAGQPPRGYVLDVATGKWGPITPEGTTEVVVAPNGQYAIGRSEQRGFELFPLGGGQSQSAKGIANTEDVVQWDASSTRVYVWDRRFPAHIALVNPWTGERKPWLETMPPDSSGVLYGNFFITPDGKTYAYRFRRVLTALFLGEGLQ
jgi:serine/threonine protein kinase